MLKDENIIETEIDGGGVLLNLETKEYYSLNETGFFIWKLMNSGLDNQEIVKKLSAEYTVSEDKALKDIEELNGQLINLTDA